MWHKERGLWRPQLKLYYPGIPPGIIASAAGGTPPGGGGGDIEFVGTPGTYTSSGQSTTHTFGYAVATTGPNRKLLVAATTEVGGGTTHTGVTYNGTAMTPVLSVSTFTNNRISLWFMDDANLPTDGESHDIVLSTGGNSNALMAAWEYKNVAQGAAGGSNSAADTNGNSFGATLTGVSEGALVVAVVTAANNERFTPGAGQERFDFGGTSNAHGLMGFDIVGASAGEITPTQQIDSGAPDTEQIAAWWAKAA